MIKGLAITPPVLGRISIGRVVEKNGMRLPEKDDAFTITTQVQNREGWILHPLHEALAAKAPNGKIRSIPVRVLFNDPDLNLRAEYSLFDRTTGRPACVGNGESAKGYTPQGLTEIPCPGPDACELGRKGGCKPYGRLNVMIEGQEDELASFIFRTTGFNSIRTLAARLSYFQAVSGGNLSGMPLSLKLRAKSTTQSHRAPVYYVDLTVREGMGLDEALAEAKARQEDRTAVGLDSEVLDQAARAGFANGAFEESEEEVPAILEEFYSESGSADAAGQQTSPAAPLRDKLKAKAGQGGDSSQPSAANG